MIALTATGAFVVVVLGGYVANWAWTGFRGNILWDWLHLMLLPPFIPAVVGPALTSIAAAGLIDAAERKRPTPASPPPGRDPRISTRLVDISLGGFVCWNNPVFPI